MAGPGSRVDMVADFLASLPAQQRDEAVFLRDLVNRALPEGYVESCAYGMIAWAIPLEIYPDTYNKQPLGLAALGARKSGLTLHLFGAYASPRLRQRLEDGFRAAGKKFDMGKGCLRFKSRDDLPLDVIEEVIGALTPADYIAVYEEARRNPGGC